jgi:hypothetical protein
VHQKFKWSGIQNNAEKFGSGVCKIKLLFISLPGLGIEPVLFLSLIYILAFFLRATVPPLSPYSKLSVSCWCRATLSARHFAKQSFVKHSFVRLAITASEHLKGVSLG